MASDLDRQRQRIRIKQKQLTLQEQQTGPRGLPLAGPQDFQDLVEADPETDRLAAQAQIEQQIDAPFASGGEVGGGGVGDFLLRMGLATQEGEEEKALRLQKKRPDFDVQTIDGPEGDPLTVFRRPGEDAFQRIDKPGGSFSGDIADALGSVGNLENLGGMLASGLSARLGGPLIRGGAGVIGSLLGNEADAQIEQSQGTELAQGSDRAAERTTAGVAAAGGEALGALIPGIKQALTGEKGLLKPTARSQEALRIARENPELGNVSAGQIAPIFKRKENQAAATGSRLSEFRSDQQQRLADSILDTVGTEGNPADVLGDQALRNANQQAQGQAFMEAGLEEGSEEAVLGAGRALQEGREGALLRRGEVKDDLFEDAFSKATPDIEFDLTAAQAQAREAIKGTKLPGAPKTVDTPEASTGLVDEAGQPIVKPAGTEEVPGEAVRIGQDFGSEMTSAMDTLNSLESVAKSANPRETFDAMKQLRTKFLGLSQADAQGKVTPEARIAGDIAKTLKEALQAPRGGSEGFTEALSAANKATFERETLRETATFKQIARSQNPQDVFSKIAKSGNVEQLGLLEKELTPKEFSTLKDGFDNWLRLDPASINRNLDTFAKDQASLRKLIPSRNTEQQLRVFGNAIERLDKSPARQVLTNTSDLSERALRIMEKGDDTQFKSFIEGAIKANPGKEKAVKSELLNATVSRVLNKHQTIKDGRVDFNMNKIANELDALIRSGRMKEVAEPNVLRALKDRTFIASILGASASDVGASMQAGSIADQALSLNPAEAAGGTLAVLHNDIWARVLTSPATVRILFGKGKTGSAGVNASLATVSKLMGIVSDDVANTPKLIFDKPEGDE